MARPVLLLGMLVGLVLLATLAACSINSVTFTPPDDAAIARDTSTSDDALPGPAPSCQDGAKNGAETDIDCGGACGPCADGGACDAPADCRSQVCASQRCQSPSCSDTRANGDETDVDCGGDCPACAVGQRCDAPADCATQVCTSNLCVAASCTDGRKNNSETDIDCGGSQCAPCGNDQACVADRDCFGLCDALQCRAALSCAELHQRRPVAGDGVYVIAPAGAPFDALCDMTRDGGGWTLLLKASASPVFANGAAAWTDDSVLNVADLSTQPGDAKYRSYLTLPITTLRGELDGFAFTKAVARQTALQLFSVVEDIVEGFPTFNTGAPNWSAQPNCHRFGINLPFSTRARFGWSANQEDNCETNDTGIGLGTNGFGAGYQCGSTECSAGPVSVGGHGLLWGR
ncbi:MAG: hypothetical protein H7138_26460 [Myxococcales bacterium]|nr:hypothetical protein [Myxococcales bacterium]